MKPLLKGMRRRGPLPTELSASIRNVSSMIGMAASIESGSFLTSSSVMASVMRRLPSFVPSFVPYPRALDDFLHPGNFVLDRGRQRFGRAANRFDAHAREALPRFARRQNARGFPDAALQLGDAIGRRHAG